MTTGLVAVRRNLAPGAVFFRQVGNVVYYSLDNKSWVEGWRLPSAPTSEYKWKQQFDGDSNMTVEQVVNLYVNMSNSLTVNNIAAGDYPPTQGQVQRNLCAAATAAAVYYLAWLDVANEMGYDAASSQASTVANIGAAIAGVIAVAATLFTGGVALAVGALAGTFAAGLVTGSEINDAIAAGDNVENLSSDPNNVRIIACAIAQAMSASGAGRNQFKNALYDTDGITGDAALAFEKLVNTTPEMYSVFLSALTDSSISACPCDDCVEYDLYTAAYTNGRFIHGNRIVSPILRTDYYGATKTLIVRFPLPFAGQVDYVRAEWAGNGLGVQSGLAWSTSNIHSAATITADYNQSASVGMTYPVAGGPPAGVYTYEYDFTPYTVAYPPHTLQVTHVCTYATLASQKNAIDRQYDWSLNYLEVCMREP